MGRREDVCRMAISQHYCSSSATGVRGIMGLLTLVVSLGTGSFAFFSFGLFLSMGHALYCADVLSSPRMDALFDLIPGFLSRYCTQSYSSRGVGVRPLPLSRSIAFSVGIIASRQLASRMHGARSQDWLDCDLLVDIHTPSPQ